MSDTPGRVRGLLGATGDDMEESLTHSVAYVECFGHGENVGPFVLLDPPPGHLRREEKMYVIAECTPDVTAGLLGIRDNQRYDRFSRFQLCHFLGRHGKPDFLVCYMTRRGYTRHLPEDAREEERVEGAPREELMAVYIESMRRRIQS